MVLLWQLMIITGGFNLAGKVLTWAGDAVWLKGSYLSRKKSDLSRNSCYLGRRAPSTSILGVLCSKANLESEKSFEPLMLLGLQKS